MQIKVVLKMVPSNMRIFKWCVIRLKEELQNLRRQSLLLVHNLSLKQRPSNKISKKLT